MPLRLFSFTTHLLSLSIFFFRSCRLVFPSSFVLASLRCDENEIDSGHQSCRHFTLSLLLLSTFSLTSLLVHSGRLARCFFLQLGIGTGGGGEEKVSFAVTLLTAIPHAPTLDRSRRKRVVSAPCRRIRFLAPNSLLTADWLDESNSCRCENDRRVGYETQREESDVFRWITHIVDE